MSTTKTARPYLANRHLWAAVTTDAGTFGILPLRTGKVMIQARWGSEYDLARAVTGDAKGTVTTPIDIGRGVAVTFHGFIERGPDGWQVDSRYTSMHQDNGGEVTRLQRERAEAVILAAALPWIESHAGDIAQANDIDRNNGAHRLEEQIIEHQKALAILRAELRKCENGKNYTMYPELPTKGR
jgi:hypothetical protein